MGIACAFGIPAINPKAPATNQLFNIRYSLCQISWLQVDMTAASPTAMSSFRPRHRAVERHGARPGERMAQSI
jgi:hypothetical protein